MLARIGVRCLLALDHLLGRRTVDHGPHCRRCSTARLPAPPPVTGVAVLLISGPEQRALSSSLRRSMLATPCPALQALQYVHLTSPGTSPESAVHAFVAKYVAARDAVPLVWCLGLAPQHHPAVVARLRASAVLVWDSPPPPAAGPQWPQTWPARTRPRGELSRGLVEVLSDRRPAADFARAARVVIPPKALAALNKR